MKKLLLQLAFIATNITAFASGTWNLGGNNFTVDTIFHATTGPGVTTTGLRLSGTVTTNVFYSTIDLSNPDLAFRGVKGKDSETGAENVNALAARANTKGYGTAISGVNGDFFNMSTDNRTCGNCMVDGRVYCTSPDVWWQNNASYAVVANQKDIRLEQSVVPGSTATFPDGRQHFVNVNPSGRPENYLAIYTPSFGASTGTNVWGRECTMKLVSGSLDYNDAVFEITSAVVGDLSNNPAHGNMAIPADGYVLSATGDGYQMMGQLKVGDRISLCGAAQFGSTLINNVHSVIGGFSYIVKAGKTADSSYLTLLDGFSSNAARTAIGFDKDKTKMIMLVADKYTANASANAEKKTYGNTSTGFAMTRLSQVMMALGCYTAMAFDGGGSSQLYNHNIGIRNVPYGGDYLRPVANGLFAVSTSPADNTIAAIEVVQKNIRLSSGETFTPKVYAYNKYGMLINTNLTGFTFKVASALGTVSGTKFTAGSAKGATIGVVSYGNVSCGVRIITNGGGTYYTSGNDNAPLEVEPFYKGSETPVAPDIPEETPTLNLTERWHFVNDQYNDGYDATAPNWSSDDAIKSKSCPRYATGRNGLFYTLDMKTMSIAEINYKGDFKPLYKLPALTGSYDGVADYYGCAISSDDAGNYLIGHLFTKSDTHRVWTIYSPKTGKAKHFAIDCGTEKSGGRIDNVGRVVGDLTRDAYVFVAPKATGVFDTQKVLMIHFEGSGDIEGVKVSSAFDGGIWMAGSGNTNSICQPKYTKAGMVTDAGPQNSFFWYSKAAGIGQWDVDLFTRNDGNTSKNYASDWNNYSGLNGFDTFTIAGKRYLVVNYASESESTTNPSGQHLIIKDEEGNTVAEWNNQDYRSTAGYNTITAVPVDDNNVDIYVYNCAYTHNGMATKGAIAGALLRVSDKEIAYEAPNEGSQSGVEEIIADDPTAPVVYYNLQGVQVKNPANGIYVRIQNGKAEKVIIR